MKKPTYPPSVLGPDDPTSDEICNLGKHGRINIDTMWSAIFDSSETGAAARKRVREILNRKATK